MVTGDVEKAPALKFGQPRVMALLLALTLFQRPIDGFRHRDLRELVDRVDAQLDQLICALPPLKAS